MKVSAFLAVVALVQLWFFGHIVYWSQANPASTAFMSRYLERPGTKVRHTWVAYDRISPHLKRAVVAACSPKGSQICSVA